MPDSSIINCHTHIFTGNHVPAVITKKFVPWPFYLLLRVQPLIALFRFWYYNELSPYKWMRRPWFKKLQEAHHVLRSYIYRVGFLNALRIIANTILIVLAVLFTTQIVSAIIGSTDFAAWAWLEEVKSFLTSPRWVSPWVSEIATGLFTSWMFKMTYIGWKVLFTVIIFLLFPQGRKFILWVIKGVWSLPGEKTREMLRRYWNIGRFAFYSKQDRIFQKLKAQYPKNTKFVVLPMDMEYMEAGESKESYLAQMEQLAMLKESPTNGKLIHPFVFVDPRRIAADKKNMESTAQKYFDFTLSKDPTGKISVNLNDCFIQDYIEKKNFSGFKIYPALGYYPFDEELLPLWKYAADNQIPILTHCIRGTIFYRGKKKNEWNYHPVFKQSLGKKKNQSQEDNDDHDFDVELEYDDTRISPLPLPQMKNIDFINNFTHPLNYLCLLKEELLRELVSTKPKLWEVFGFVNLETPLTENLSHLKICFGHFGGDDEWNKYFESDRDVYSPHLMKRDEGIDFMFNSKNEFSWHKLEQLWKYTDWYSIICSMMLQHPNVYSDISYIVHNPAIMPLLNRTLMREERKLTTGAPLRERVLFGTDFYVVRNHKSEKQMHADMLNNLDAEEWDLIARKNPRSFLSSVLNPIVG